MARGRGFIADKPHWLVGCSTLCKLPDLCGAATLPASVSLRNAVDRVRDQGSTASCVGQALASAAHIRSLLTGQDRPYPSAYGVYTIARLLDRAHWTTPLEDVGSMPYLATLGARRFGLVPESQWSHALNEDLDFTDYMALSDARIKDYYRIDSSGLNRMTEVRQALASGYPVTLAVECDDAFERGEGIIPAFSGPGYGGHYITAVGYHPYGVDVLNSWGTGWGLEGFGVLSWERVMDATTTHLQAVSVCRL